MRSDKGKPRIKRAHCKRGHDMTPANTWTAKDGRRYCKTCRHSTPSYKRGRSTGKAPKCGAGHIRTVTNTLIDRRGRKHCQQCVFGNKLDKRQSKRSSHDEEHPSVTELMEQQAAGPEAMLKAYLEKQARERPKG